MKKDKTSICCEDIEGVEKDPNVQFECITSNRAFIETVLNKFVLDFFLADLERKAKTKTEKQKLKKASVDENRQYRYVAYRFYVRWVKNFKKMGYKQRIKIPSCVIWAIRGKWPDLEDQYTGYHSADSDTGDENDVQEELF
jgi:hypothetical protein